MNPLKELTPEQKQMAAMAIVQHHILASDSYYDANAMFGRMYMSTCHLELAASLMEDCLEHLPDKLVDTALPAEPDKT